MSFDDDFAHRELCPDDACIGIIGPDGACKVCGRISPSAVADPRTAGMTVPAVAVSQAVTAGPAHARPQVDPEPGSFDDRELCPDEGCIGLIGSDRTCKVCGRPARSGPG